MTPSPTSGNDMDISDVGDSVMDTPSAQKPARKRKRAHRKRRRAPIGPLPAPGPSPFPQRRRPRHPTKGTSSDGPLLSRGSLAEVPVMTETNWHRKSYSE